MAQIRVGVLRGGPSSEYAVSLQTGASVLENLNRDVYAPVDIFIDKKGVWHVGGFPMKEAQALRHADVVVNALHGQYGEDGTVQRILDAVGVPYTGSGSFASSVAFHKALAKHTLFGEDIKMAPHILLEKGRDIERKLFDAFRSIPHPSVVKPVSAGSSVGVSIVHTLDELMDAAVRAFEHSPKIMVEEFVKGREATCGVVENFRGEDLYALFPIEIIPPREKPFYDYEAKYVSDDTNYVLPGNFRADEKAELQRLAKLVHTKLGLRHYSRSDFIVSPRGIYFLEVNTLPGFTEHSLVPKALSAIGCSFPHFLDHLIGLALKK